MTRDEGALARARRAMAARPDDPAARMACYAALADAELHLMLDGEAEGDRVRPAIVTLEEGAFALGFDSEEGLADFAEGPVGHVTLPGRIVAQLLARQGIGLAVNPGGAGTGFLCPPEALAWLAGTLGRRPDRAALRPVAWAPPDGVPAALAAALAARLEGLAGLARRAHLVRARYEDDSTGLLLVVEGARPEAEEAIAKALAEAALFSGAGGEGLDVTFLPEGAPALARLAAQAMRLDIPDPEPEAAAPGAGAASAPAGPGMDPARPPRLR